MNRLVKSESVYWCNDDDRYIRVFKVGMEVVGINYMQGDELDLFEERYKDIDEDLTNFYNALSPYLNGDTEIDRINQATWAHFDYKNNY
jgi:hypothetical protein